jgi:hypothetical protein
MDVVQDEAESVLLDTAAIVQGVRAGAKTIGGRVAESAPGGDAQERASPEEGEEADEAMAREAPERA